MNNELQAANAEVACRSFDGEWVAKWRVGWNLGAVGEGRASSVKVLATGSPVG